MRNLLLLCAAVLLVSGCGGGATTGQQSVVLDHLEQNTRPAVGLGAAPSRDEDADEDETSPEDDLAELRRLLVDLRRELDAALARLDILLSSEDEENRTASLQRLPWQHQPIVDLDTAALVERRILSGVRHIGSDVAPLPAGTTCDTSGLLDHSGQPAPVPSARWCEDPLPDHTLPAVAQHGDVAVSHGQIRDGVGRDQVVAWLRAHAVAAQDYLGRDGLPIAAQPFTIRIFEGMTDTQIGYIVDAVRFINAGLPHEWRLTIAEEPTPVLEPLDIPLGEIHVGFTTTLLTEYDSGRYNGTTVDGEFGAGRVLIYADLGPYGWRHPPIVATMSEHDHYQTNVGLLAHEIMHGMGFLDHPDMASALSYDRTLTGWAGLAGHILYPLDRDGMLAAFTRLAPGFHRPEDIAQELGPWSDTSTHVRGVIGLPDGGDMAFGAAHRNGFAQPWAYGPAPDTDLADNAALSGTVHWQGRLLGLTPDTRTVAGEAALAVELSTLDGKLAFSDLEAWSSGAAPGVIGTGSTWGDGALDYTVAVQGSTFIQKSGDEGQITGAFFGAEHQGMAGTLDRSDLAAGFGGTRE